MARRTVLHRRRWLWSVAGVWLPLAAGCAHDNALSYDPLIGGSPAQPAAGAAAPPAPKTAATLPPMPAPHNATSTAALAGGRLQPLDGGSDLRIASVTTQPRGDGWKAPANPGGVTLQPPAPLNQTPVRPVGVVPVSGGALTYEQAQARLAARGVLWQKLEAVGGEWWFSCAVPNRQNPNLQRRYEARNADQLTAIRAVLEQIEQNP